MASKIEPLITVADLDALPDDGNRYELIEGELFVSRAPGIPHQRVLQNLQVALAHYLAKNPIGILVPGAGAVLSEYDAVIPDLALVLSEHWEKVVSEDRFVMAPDLVAEIISPGKENRRRDLIVKRQVYAKYSVKEYWILDPERRSVMVFSLEGQTLKENSTLTAEEELSSPLFPGLAVRVSALFLL
jgi:Uma2 family endonuclease